MKNKLMAGTRSSALAQWQTDWVMGELKKSGVETQKVLILTTGDINPQNPLYEIGDKGLFTKELDTALLDGRIDFAVHSLKDLPTTLPEGLILASITEREDPRDALISRDGVSLSKLPPDASIATGSLRRRAQLLVYQRGFQIQEIRGNVETRIKKFRAAGWEGLILASAGLKRLGYADQITEAIPFEIMLPAVGQGSLGVVCREKDSEIIDLLKTLEHTPSSLSIRAERAFLKTLEGGCQVPLGALGELRGEEVFLRGFIGDLKGEKWVRGELAGPAKNPEKIGLDLAKQLASQGGKAILEEIRNQLGT